VQALDALLRKGGLAPGETFDLIKRSIVPAHLVLVAFASWEVLIFGDDFCGLLPGEKIAFHHRGVMCRVQAAVSRRFASTRGVIGNASIACFTASIRINPRAIAGVMLKTG